MLILEGDIYHNNKDEIKKLIKKKGYRYVFSSKVPDLRDEEQYILEKYQGNNTGYSLKSGIWQDDDKNRIIMFWLKDEDMNTVVTIIRDDDMPEEVRDFIIDIGGYEPELDEEIIQDEMFQRELERINRQYDYMLMHPNPHQAKYPRVHEYFVNRMRQEAIEELKRRYGGDK